MVEAMKRAERSPHDMPVPRLPAWAADRVAELSAARADAVAASGVRVVGDVDSLRTVAAADVGAEEVASISLDSVVRGLAGSVEGHRRLEGRVRRERRRLARVERRLDARARGTIDEATDPPRPEEARCPAEEIDEGQRTFRQSEVFDHECSEEGDQQETGRHD
jgi:hypothetical protein